MSEEQDPLLQPRDAVRGKLLPDEVGRQALDGLEVEVIGGHGHLVADQPHLELEGELVARALHHYVAVGAGTVHCL